MRGAAHVMADVPDRPDRVIKDHVPDLAAGFEEAEQEVGCPDLEHRRSFRHRGVTGDDVQATVKLRVGVRLVTGVDDGARARRGARDRLPYVVGTLRETETGLIANCQQLARAGEDLAGDEKGNERVGKFPEVPRAAHEVILVTAVGVAGRVRVVLKKVNRAWQPVLDEARLGVGDEPFKDPLPAAVICHELTDVVTFCRRVFGV